MVTKEEQGTCGGDLTGKEKKKKLGGDGGTKEEKKNLAPSIFSLDLSLEPEFRVTF